MYALTKEAKGWHIIMKSALPLATAGASVGNGLERPLALKMVTKE